MLMMENEYIYTEARISKSIVGEQWETDEAGNPIIIIEASNENLDFEGEKVLRSALLNSKEYFLQNGVVSYDHKHLPSPDNFNWDPEWNAEKYVLGHPLDAWEAKSEETGEKVVRVKAAIYKSNAIAKEIIGKLMDKAKTVKASVGGRKVKKALKMDTSTYKETPTIVAVNWDEVALTYKPVNQTLGATTLCPKDFVKSLTAGSEANPAKMEGGNTLQMQGKESIHSLMRKIRNKEIEKSCDAINHLVSSGYSEKKASAVLKVLIDKKFIGDIIMADGDDVNAVIVDSTDELEKAIKDFEGGGDEASLAKAMKKMDKDGNYVKQNGHMYMKKADGEYEKMDDDSPDYEKDDDDGGDTQKSIPDENGDVIIDVELIEGMAKSIKSQKGEIKELKTMIKSLITATEKQGNLVKAIGTTTLEDSTLLKSIAGAPQKRVTTNGLNIDQRFGKDTMSKAMEEKLMSFDGISLAKSMVEKGIDAEVAANVNHTFRTKGGMRGVVQYHPEVAKKVIKE